MNKLTFIQEHIQKYKTVKTKAGFPIEIDHANCTNEKIAGFVIFPKYNYKMPIEWDINGRPLKLPLHYGLDIVPLKTVVSFEGIPVEERV